MVTDVFKKLGNINLTPFSHNFYLQPANKSTFLKKINHLNFCSFCCPNSMLTQYLLKYLLWPNIPGSNFSSL